MSREDFYEAFFDQQENFYTALITQLEEVNQSLREISLHLKNVLKKLDEVTFAGAVQVDMKR